MTPQDLLDAIGRSTAHAGMATSRDLLLGSEVLVARTSQFRWRWMATKLHTFLVAAVFPSDAATPDQLDGFLRAATEYAKAHKTGLPVGLQTGVAVIVVAVTENASPAAHGWAAAPHGRQFGVVPFPVLADVVDGQVTRPQRMVIGGIYAGYLKGLVDHHVTGALHWRPAE
jgi:hypothetical protein